MGFMELIRNLFGKKAKEVEAPPEPAPAAAPEREKRTCKNCGKNFTIDPSWKYIPNYCKDCRKKFNEEKEARQRAGEPRRIKRKCRECGKFFTFPNTLAHYPSYCNDCRKRHQAAMKQKYSQKGKA